MAETTNTVTVTLDTPIKMGDTEVTTIDLRKPLAGELRGISLSALMSSDYAAVETILPRITTPILHKLLIAAMDPADFMQLASEVISFLLPKALKAQLPSE